MTYPPTNPGYPPSQPPGPYGAPAPSYAPAEAGPSKLPLYLNVAVVVLGLAAYLASFGPILTINADLGPFGGAELSGGGGGYPVLATLVAALLAAASLLPKARDYGGVDRHGIGDRGADGDRPGGRQADRLHRSAGGCG